MGPRPSQNLFLGTGAPSNHFWDAAQQEAEDDVDSKCYAYEGNPTSRNHVFQQQTSLKDNYNTWEPTIYDDSGGSAHYVGHRNLYVSLPMEEQLENARIFFASDAANEINEVWKKSNGQMTQEMRVAMSEVRQLLADNGTTYDAYIAVLREKVKKPGGRHKKGNLKAADFTSSATSEDDCNQKANRWKRMPNVISHMPCGNCGARTYYLDLIDGKCQNCNDKVKANEENLDFELGREDDDTNDNELADLMGAM